MDSPNSTYKEESLLSLQFKQLLAEVEGEPADKGKIILKRIYDDGKPLSLNEMLGLVELKHRGSFIKRHLQPLIASGLVVMVNPSAKTSPNQRYQLSTKGLIYMARADWK